MTKKRSLSGLLFFCYIVQKAQKKLSFLVILPLEKKSEICYNLLVNKEVKPQREELKKMTQQELNKILENHKHWISKDCDEWIKLRADLHGADLRKADLHGADLRKACIYGADLHGADLRGADLRGAYLCWADLHGADLRGADLHGAYLRGADLHGADLHGADLCRADLRGAYLCWADLHGADLRGADLHGAYLRGADLHGADLTGANLRDAEGIPFTPFVCPDTGSFIAYKKAGGYIVKLQIPEDAKRLSATSRKCRCDKAQVLEIQNLGGTTADLTEIRSDHDKNFIYKVGKIVSVDNFDENRWNECSTGIHFFINRQEAVEY